MTKADDRPAVVLWRERLRDSDAHWAMKYVGVIMSLRMTGPNGSYTASLETLCEETGLSESTARRARRDLVKHQWLTCTPGGGRGNTNDYKLPKPRQSKGVPEPKGCQSKGVPEPKGCQSKGVPDPERVSDERGSEAKGGQNGAERVSEKPVKGVSLTPEVVTTEVVTAEVELLAPTSRRDPIWDAVVEACGIEPTEITKQQRGGIASAVAELKRVGATPRKIADRAREYQRRFDGAALTAPALAKHWSSLGRAAGSVNTAAGVQDWLASRNGAST